MLLSMNEIVAGTIRYINEKNPETASEIPSLKVHKLECVLSPSGDEESNFDNDLFLQLSYQRGDLTRTYALTVADVKAALSKQMEKPVKAKVTTNVHGELGMCAFTRNFLGFQPQV